MNEIIKLRDGYEARIEYDTDCEQPYEDDNGIIICIRARNRIDPSKGSIGTEREEITAWSKENAVEWYSVPLWMHDHSATTYAVGEANPFRDPWDSGWVGLIALKRSEWFNGKATDEQFLEAAKSIAETYTTWAEGETYQFVIVNKDGEEEDSCSGFIGRDAVIEGIQDAGFSLREDTPGQGLSL